MIKFNCVNCKEEMEAPQSLVGQTIKCPKCGNVTMVPESISVEPQQVQTIPQQVQIVSPKVQTIELTSKKYKGIQLVSIFGLIIGIIGVISSHHGVFGIIIFLSIIAYIYSRIGAWWHHG